MVYCVRFFSYISDIVTELKRGCGDEKSEFEVDHRRSHVDGGGNRPPNALKLPGGYLPRTCSIHWTLGHERGHALEPGRSTPNACERRYRDSRGESRKSSGRA